MPKVHLSREVQCAFQSVECAAKKFIHGRYSYKIGAKKESISLSIFLSGLGGAQPVKVREFDRDADFKAAKKEIKEIIGALDREKKVAA